MTVTDTAPAVVSETATGSRSLAKALLDLRDGVANYRLWGHLGWQDTKQKYRRSLLGPWWISVSQGTVALGLGLLNGLLFAQHFQTFLPYLATGLIVWTYINGCLMEGMQSFIANEGMIKHMPAPLTLYALRTVWRQFLMFAHNAVVYVALVAIFLSDLDHRYSMKTGDCVKAVPGSGIPCHPGLGWNALLAVPGFLLVTVNMIWVTIFFGIISSRFRDFPQLIGSVVILLFYLTPIVWPMDQLTAVGGRRHELSPYVLPVIDFNPVYHLVQVVRSPLIGQLVSVWSFVACGLMAAVGWAITLLAMRGYRARVSYWV